MERRVFASEEVYSYEVPHEEPIDLPESQLRFRQNVGYIPHMLPPVLILEYVPYYYNYQTYEPYLINRFEVAYVPFVRQVSYIQFVPYYSLQAPESISNSAQYEDGIFSNSDSSTGSSDTFEPETSELSFLSEDNDSEHTESPSEVILESSSYRDKSTEPAHFDDLEYEDDVKLSTSDVDEISILSVSSSESSGSVSEMITLDETSRISGSQGLPYAEVSSYDNEPSSDWKHPEITYSADDAGCDMEANFINSSCFDVTKKSDHVNQIEQASLDNSSSKKEDISYNDSEHDTASQFQEGISSTDDSDRAKEADFIELSCFDVTKKSDHVNQIEQASLDNSISKKEDISYNDSEHDTASQFQEGISNTDDSDRSKEADFINSSCFDVTKKSDHVNQIEQASLDNSISKKEDISYNDSEHDITSQYPEEVSSTDDSDRAKEADFINSSCFDVTKKSDHVNQIEQASLDNSISKKEDISYNDSEHDIASQYPEEVSSTDDSDRAKETDFINSSCFDVTKKSDHVNQIDQAFLEVVNPIDEDRASLDDRWSGNEVESFYNDDEDDGPPIRSILEDILPSDNYWRVQRKEYCIRRNNQELYRSALEGDIYPRRSLPDVGTLDTIFEDLPFPVNQPYDNGLESNTDENFDVALASIEAERSESSTTALIPKKKRFKNTRKLFSRLFWCFKSKTVKAAKPP